MNICVISSYPPPPTGIGTYTKELYTALSGEFNIKVVILSNTVDYKSNKLVVVKAWGGDEITYPLRLFMRIVLARFDIIHIQHEHWLYGRGIRSITFLILLLLLKFLRRPIVITMHCTLTYKELTSAFFKKHRLGARATLIKKLYLTIYHALINLLASKVIVHSSLARRILVNEWGFEVGKVVVIPHGTSLIHFRQSVKEANFDFTLLIFGEIRRGKGIEYAIGAMPKILSEVPACTLIIAGMYDTKLSPESAGYLEELNVLIRKLRLENHVALKTNISEDDVKSLFLAADIVIFPYVEDEIVAASGPVLTALGFGKPIIATRLRRFNGYLRDGENAIMVPPANSDELARAIISLLKDSQVRDKLSRSSMRLAQSLDWKNVAKKTLALYEELMNK
ncbi:MAG: glycosyltransferase [Candidatus Nezhaarchaeales archaeon]